MHTIACLFVLACPGPARHGQDADAAGAAGDPGAHRRRAGPPAAHGAYFGVRGHQCRHRQPGRGACGAGHQRDAPGPARQGDQGCFVPWVHYREKQNPLSELSFEKVSDCVCCIVQSSVDPCLLLPGLHPLWRSPLFPKRGSWPHCSTALPVASR